MSRKNDSPPPKSTLRRGLTLALGATLTIAAAAAPAAAGVTERVSVDSAGIESDAPSMYPAIDRSGRTVAFASWGDGFVPGDTNNAMDIFVHDRKTGLTSRASVDSAGQQGNGLSVLPTLSRDGRYVAFESDATNLVAGDTNGARDIFVHDRKAGTTTRVSVDGAGAEADAPSFISSISSNGRYVVFMSGATNLVAGDGNGKFDVFLRDLKTGTTTRVSVNRAGGEGNDHSTVDANCAVSSTGRLVPFASNASNLVPGDINGTTDAFVHDVKTGQTFRVSVDSSGNEGNGSSAEVTMSPNGRLVAFTSNASNLVPGDGNGQADVFVHDRKTGTTTRVSVDSAGVEGNGSSSFATFSDDGRYVGFLSDASNLVPGDTNGTTDFFVHDLKTGETTRASVDGAGNESNGAIEIARISGNGRIVVLQSGATNLVPADVNGNPDIFVHDRKD